MSYLINSSLWNEMWGYRKLKPQKVWQYVTRKIVSKQCLAKRNALAMKMKTGLISLPDYCQGSLDPSYSSGCAWRATAQYLDATGQMQPSLQSQPTISALFMVVWQG